jgi:hypothetical protein
MKKKLNILGLINVFSELGKDEIDETQLNDELVKIGVSPDKLMDAVKNRIEKIKLDQGISMVNPTVQEFDPFLLAASKKSIRLEKIAKRLKKRP